MHPSRPLAVAALTAALTAALLSATPAALASPIRSTTPPPTAKCGEDLADYVGISAPDTAFLGIVEDNGTQMPFTATPRNTAGVVKAQIDSQDVRGLQSIESGAEVGVDYAGKGSIAFRTPHGAALSDDVICGNSSAPSRVTEITGTIFMGGDRLEVFVLSRR